MVTNLNACLDQDGVKEGTSVVKLCHNIYLRHVNRNPDSLKKKAKIKYKFKEVRALLSTKDRALQNRDKKRVDLTKRSKLSIIVIINILTNHRKI